MRTRRATLVAAALGVVVATACGGGSGTASEPAPVREAPAPRTSTPAAPAPPTRGPLRAHHPAWAAVSVATVWRSPAAPRAVDAPALARPAQIQQWLQAMTLDERRALNGRADTQVLLGDRVDVVRLRPGWARVTVPGQPTPLDAGGYPGWVPRRQLTAVPPAQTPRVATVTVGTAWLRADAPSARPLWRVGFGTDLPVVGRAPGSVRVVLPTGAVRRVARTAVVLHQPDEPAFAPSRASVVARARSFVGLAYLWAGTSGFGLDCSGLTWLTYRAHGIRLPRDASAQATFGRAVTRLRPGDLMFFGDPVHHVAMYAGHGRMVHAPGTGQSVQVVPVSTPPYAHEYAGACRVLH
ncbi:MAG: C40 family peptidase [Nocardioides sp.]|nr:C40 family peptidase [Nocardioidaceae bacterium]MCB8955459.1 C40 family peptidase [Nocardioides sp.]